MKPSEAGWRQFTTEVSWLLQGIAQPSDKARGGPLSWVAIAIEVALA